MTPTSFPHILPPRCVTVARAAALTQSVTILVGAFVSIGLAVSSYWSDRAAAQRGEPNDWSGLTELIGGVAGALAIAVALVVGLPALMMRSGRPGVRVALIVGEAVTAFFTSGALVLGVRLDLWTVVRLAYTALTVTVLVAITRPAARQWAEAALPAEPPRVMV